MKQSRAEQMPGAAMQSVTQSLTPADTLVRASTGRAGQAGITDDGHVVLDGTSEVSSRTAPLNATMRTSVSSLRDLRGCGRGTGRWQARALLPEVLWTSTTPKGWLPVFTEASARPGRRSPLAPPRQPRQPRQPVT